MTEPIILDGIPVPQFARLEVRGAQLASFRVLKEPPVYLGGKMTRPGRVLVPFYRTDENEAGYSVFRPIDGKPKTS